MTKVIDERDAVHDELEALLFDGYTGRWSESRYARLLARCPLESDISALIAALVGGAGRAATDFLAHAGGHVPDRERFDYWIVSDVDPVMKQFRRTTSADGARSSAIRPDIFVCRRRKAWEDDELVVAVELKHHAVVNYINCPTGLHADYSNQLVCYPAGCWLKDPSISSDVGYVWLAPQAELSDDAICRKALNGDPARYERWNATPVAYERQMSALKSSWGRASIEGLVEALRPLAPMIADVIGKWVER
ncbi:hypothetical protein [Brachybacterium alimentarium]|uniref:hypothetical protein n=1 Tax=Brachybacterium alimentarium TaxID=47845 RepID=UPI000DF41B83|nr:hypothetical protein [Brachybacterium alimentarium]RCS76900.1 hypothetical protein CIK72_15070 [Brachybacterium alimentarium]RCS79606.1 hypothetical protein CIK70_07145 [Brachybacterium alimentarium]